MARELRLCFRIQNNIIFTYWELILFHWKLREGNIFLNMNDNNKLKYKYIYSYLKVVFLWDSQRGYEYPWWSSPTLSRLFLPNKFHTLVTFILKKCVYPYIFFLIYVPYRTGALCKIKSKFFASITHNYTMKRISIYIYIYSNRTRAAVIRRVFFFETSIRVYTLFTLRARSWWKPYHRQRYTLYRKNFSVYSKPCGEFSNNALSKIARFFQNKNI